MNKAILSLLILLSASSTLPSHGHQTMQVGLADKRAGIPALQGRVEQEKGGAKKLPQLRKRNPSLDQTDLFGGVTTSDTDLNGNWGGTLVVQESDVAPALVAHASKPYYSITVGTKGSVNFNFRQIGRKISLQPVKVLFMVPISTGALKESQLALVRKLEQNPTMRGQNLSYLLKNQPLFPIKMPFLCILGAGRSSGLTPERSARVLTEQVREIRKGILEHQITCAVTYHLSDGRLLPGTYRARTMFVGIGDGLMQVKLSQMAYGPNMEYYGKLVANGCVRKGAVVSLDPLTEMMSDITRQDRSNSLSKFGLNQFRFPSSTPGVSNY